MKLVTAFFILSFFLPLSLVRAECLLGGECHYFAWGEGMEREDAIKNKVLQFMQSIELKTFSVLAFQLLDSSKKAEAELVIEKSFPCALGQHRATESPRVNQQAVLYLNLSCVSEKELQEFFLLYLFGQKREEIKLAPYSILEKPSTLFPVDDPLLLKHAEHHILSKVAQNWGWSKEILIPSRLDMTYGEMRVLALNDDTLEVWQKDRSELLWRETFQLVQSKGGAEMRLKEKKMVTNQCVGPFEVERDRENKHTLVACLSRWNTPLQFLFFEKDKLKRAWKSARSFFFVPAIKLLAPHLYALAGVGENFQVYYTTLFYPLQINKLQRKDWQNLGGKAFSSPALYREKNGSLGIYVTDYFGKLWKKINLGSLWYPEDESWLSLSREDSRQYPLGAEQKNGPYRYYNAPRLGIPEQIFYRGANHMLFVLQQGDERSQSVPLGGYLTSAPAVTEMSAWKTSLVFYRDHLKRLVMRFQKRN